VDSLTNRFVRSSGSFVVDGFQVGQEIRASGFLLNNGTFHITAVTATAITVSEVLLAGELPGDGNEALSSRGTVVMAGSVGGGGLLNLMIIASDSIEIDDGATVSTRQVAAGADPRTAPSTTNSGNITLTAPSIVVGQGSALLAHATGAF